MAKVLLINSNRFRHPWPVIPFGLCYIAASLEANSDNHVSFLDLCFSSDCEEDIRKSVMKFSPDVIGISIRNIDDTGGYNVRFLLEDVKNDVIEFCKKEFKGPIVIGGPSVGISAVEMLDYFDLEYAIRGDGEAVMPEFVKRLKKNESLDGLQGLIIRRGKTIVQHSEPYRVEELDSHPFPHLLRYIDLEHYRSFGSPLHIQTKRGCAFRCSYCTYNNIEGRKYRLKNPGRVADEIELLVNETGVRHFEFTDSIFNVPLPHTKEVLRAIISKNLDLSLHTMGLSPSAVDEELLDLMKCAGFDEVDIGAESMCDEILESLSKEFKRTDIIKTAELLKMKNLPVTWFIILGSGVETRETVSETLNTIGSIASKWDLVFVSTGIRVYNGAPIADEMIKNNPFCTSDSFLHPVKIEPANISLREIHAIAKEFSFRFPNFYFYEIDNIIPGWLLATGNYLLRLFRSRQPVWRLLIFIRRIEKVIGISLLKRYNYAQKIRRAKEKDGIPDGFSLIKTG
jgi:anaerobic magnesium-protoporphyrin IX monomethyl ester cyclase